MKKKIFKKKSGNKNLFIYSTINITISNKKQITEHLLRARHNNKYDEQKLTQKITLNRCVHVRKSHEKLGIGR